MNKTVLQLEKIGVRIINTTVGTRVASWVVIKSKHTRQIEIGKTFSSWGIPTAETTQECRKIHGIFLIWME